MPDKVVWLQKHLMEKAFPKNQEVKTLLPQSPAGTCSGGLFGQYIAVLKEVLDDSSVEIYVSNALLNEIRDVVSRPKYPDTFPMTGYHR